MIFRVSSHTDFVGAGTTYVAIPGTKSNGLDFIPQAIERGATAVVVPAGAVLSEELKSLCTQKNITIYVEPDTRAALCSYAARAYGHPAQKLKIIGVTGTDGKTTSAYLLHKILCAAGVKAALLSGVEIVLGEEVSHAQLTTAKPDFLHCFFDQCVQKGLTHVVMEVSAQAHTLHRIDGIEFDGFIFTNLAKEHGEQYKTLDEYFEAKCGVLRHLKSGAPLVVNIDTMWGKKLLPLFNRVVTCGFNGAEYQVRVTKESLDGQEIALRLKDFEHELMLTTPLSGAYNASNILGAVALCCELGVGAGSAQKAVQGFTGAPGRMQKFKLKNGALAVVDYAHTPQAFAALLPHLAKHANNLFVIFGCGGGKDQQKRPMLARAAIAHAQRVILTNDNPRHENPEAIMDAIMAELNEQERLCFTREQDREHAIKIAFQESCSGDIIAILGKGNETVQLIGAQQIPHSDLGVVQSLM